MKNVLKITSAAVLALFAATDASQAHNFKSGFVAGGAVGYSHMSTKMEQGAHVVVPALERASKKTNTSNAFIFSLDSGYRYVMENGVVVGFNLAFSKDFNRASSTNQLVTGNSTRVTLRRLYQVTPSLLLGKTIEDNWMIFTDLGLSISRFKAKGTNTGAGNEFGSSKTFTKVGFAPAIGAEYAVNKNISVTAKATYEIFASTKKDFGNFVAPPTVSNFDAKVKPRYFTAKIGAIYKF